jgi:hypothetical protein
VPADTQTAPPPEQEQNYTPIPQSGFGALASDIYGAPLAAAREQRGAAGERLVESIRAKGEATRPLIESAQASLARPLPEPPKGPVLPPSPSRQLHDFLAPVEGEPPERSVMKLISALSVMGTGIGGLAKGDARAALAGMTGALKGWQEGEKDRADRAFSDWEAATARLLKNYEVEHRTYRDIMEDANLTNEQRLTAVKLAALQYDNPILAAKIEVGNYDAVIADLAQAQTHADNVQTRTQAIQLAHEDKVRQQDLLAAYHKQQEADRVAQREATEQRHRETLAEHRRSADQRYDLEKQKFEHQVAAENEPLAEAELNELVEQYRNGESLYQLTRGFGKAATKRVAQIQKAAAEKDREEGIAPGSVVLTRRNLQANTGALRALSVDEARFKSFLTSFEMTVENVKRLSEEVKRSGIPKWNRYQLQFAADFQGNEAAKNLIAQMEILAREADRVLSRARGAGAEASRQEARNIFNPGMTDSQLDSLITKVFSRDAMYGAMGFEQEKKKLQSAIGVRPGAAGTEAPATKPGAPSGWKIEEVKP